MSSTESAGAALIGDVENASDAIDISPLTPEVAGEDHGAPSSGDEEVDAAGETEGGDDAGIFVGAEKAEAREDPFLTALDTAGPVHPAAARTMTSEESTVASVEALKALKANRDTAVSEIERRRALAKKYSIHRHAVRDSEGAGAGAGASDGAGAGAGAGAGGDPFAGKVKLTGRAAIRKAREDAKRKDVATRMSTMVSAAEDGADVTTASSRYPKFSYKFVLVSAANAELRCPKSPIPALSILGFFESRLAVITHLRQMKDCMKDRTIFAVEPGKAYIIPYSEERATDPTTGDKANRIIARFEAERKERFDEVAENIRAHVESKEFKSRLRENALKRIRRKDAMREHASKALGLREADTVKSAQEKLFGAALSDGEGSEGSACDEEGVETREERADREERARDMLGEEDSRVNTRIVGRYPADLKLSGQAFCAATFYFDTDRPEDEPDKVNRTYAGNEPVFIIYNAAFAEESDMNGYIENVLGSKTESMVDCLSMYEWIMPDAVDPEAIRTKERNEEYNKIQEGRKAQEGNIEQYKQWCKTLGKDPEIVDVTKDPSVTRRSRPIEFKVESQSTETMKAVSDTPVFDPAGEDAKLLGTTAAVGDAAFEEDAVFDAVEHEKKRAAARARRQEAREAARHAAAEAAEGGEESDAGARGGGVVETKAGEEGVDTTKAVAEKADSRQKKPSRSSAARTEKSRSSHTSSRRSASSADKPPARPKKRLSSKAAARMAQATKGSRTVFAPSGPAPSLDALLSSAALAPQDEYRPTVPAAPPKKTRCSRSKR